MSHPFGNDHNRFGSAAFVRREELEDAGFFSQTPTSLYCGEFNGRPLHYSGDGGAVMVGGARGGKFIGILGQLLCSGLHSGGSLLMLDLKGEGGAVSHDQTPDRKYCIYWNPPKLHGLPQHRINPVDYLKKSSVSLFADVKVFVESVIPRSAAAQSEYFELRGREYMEAICHTLIELNGILTLPDLYEAVNLIALNDARWKEFAYEMYCSGNPLCRRVEAEIAASRDDSSGGFRGILGEMFKSVACLSDPVLRDSVSPPYDFSLNDLCSYDQFVQFYMICAPETVSIWAPVIKSIFTAAMIYKSRQPQAPTQTWVLDECAQLKGFELVPKMFTYGAGIGIRPFAVFQSLKQMDALDKNARDIILSSAALQIYFAIRDLGTAQALSNTLGAETLTFDDPLHQGRAELEREAALRAIFGGADPFAAAAGLFQKSYEARHLSKIRRMMMNPDELMNMPGGSAILRVSGLSGPVLVDIPPYWTQSWMAGRYHPNPYHPPSDKVLVQTRWGSRWRPAITEPVPDEFAHYPQYASGLWSRIGR